MYVYVYLYFTVPIYVIRVRTPKYFVHISTEYNHAHLPRLKKLLYRYLELSRLSVPLIRAGPPGYFIHISITTPVVSALKNYYI